MEQRLGEKALQSILIAIKIWIIKKERGKLIHLSLICFWKEMFVTGASFSHTFLKTTLPKMTREDTLGTKKILNEKNETGSLANESLWKNYPWHINQLQK